MLNLLSLLNYRSPALFSPRFLIAPQFLLRERLVSRLLRRTISSSPAMDREVDSVPHVDRTASEPRDPNLHTLRLEKIEDVNSTIRLFKLRASENGVKFLPGQWLDLYLPGVDQAGGFTITSAPAHAAPVTSGLATSLNIDPSPREQENILLRPYLELAVQQSPNKPAAWLWRPKSDILGSTVDIRVGGSFVWPPSTSTTPPQDIQKAVFIAGGVGINPLISIISHLHQTDTMPPLVEFIYATKFTTGEILFADRLLHIASNRPQQVKLQFFLTGAEGISAKRLEDGRLVNLAISPSYRRLDKKDVLDALRASKKEQTVCYVCGPPQMTDELVEFLRKQEGMSADRVLCEKWW